MQKYYTLVQGHLKPRSQDSKHCTASAELFQQSKNNGYWMSKKKNAKYEKIKKPWLKVVSIQKRHGIHFPRPNENQSHRQQTVEDEFFRYASKTHVHDPKNTNTYSNS